MTTSTQTNNSMCAHDAFAYCRKVTREHYENFPVASLLIPRRIRPFVYAVYAFSRGADDIADEGDLTPAERLHRLDQWQTSLDRTFAGDPPTHPVFIALAETARQTQLPQQPLADLLTAFRMDVQICRYQRFDDLLRYCSFSANPVGRLVLHLFGHAAPENLLLSDNICTALQLTNFWQDVATDWSKGRLYVPLEDMELFRYTEGDLSGGVADERFRGLLRYQIARTRGLFDAGAPLVRHTGPRLGFELALTLAGGRAILDAIERQGCDTLSRRPALSTGDKATLFLKALTGRMS